MLRIWVGNRHDVAVVSKFALFFENTVLSSRAADLKAFTASNVGFGLNTYMQQRFQTVWPLHYCLLRLSPVNSMTDRTSAFFGQRAPVILDIGQLKKSGVLSNQNKKVWLDAGLPIEIWRSGNIINISYPRVDPAISLEFPINDGRFWNNFRISIVFRNLNFGERPYFVCPISRQDCLKLLLCEDFACSKSAYKQLDMGGHFSQRSLASYEAGRRFLKKDGTRRLSALEKERLLDRIKQHSESFRDDRELEKAVHNFERRRARERRKFEWESRPLSTSKGLDCGRGLGQDRIFEEYLSRDLGSIDDLQSPRLREGFPKDFIDAYPELDIKVLLSRFDLTPTGVTAKSLGWPENATDNKRIAMFCDPRFSGLPRLVFAITNLKNGQETWQMVKLLPGPTSPKPRYFLCPVTSARCEHLYFRQGMFASREAHRLRLPQDRQT